MCGVVGVFFDGFVILLGCSFHCVSVVFLVSWKWYLGMVGSLVHSREAGFRLRGVVAYCKFYEMTGGFFHDISVLPMCVQ